MLSSYSQYCITKVMLEKGAITGPSDSYYLTMGGGKSNLSCVCKLKRESNFSSFEDNNSVFSVLSGPQNEVLPCCCGIHLLMDLLSMIALR